MGNWQEKIRQIQEEERRRILAQEEKARIARQAQQEAQLKAAKDAELRAREENERKANFFEILDKLKVKQSLEDIRRQVWQGHGSVVESKSDSVRLIRLLFDFETQIPEVETKKWTERKEESYTYVDQGGSSRRGTFFPRRESTRVKTWYVVKKPSYLEVGVDTNSVRFEVYRLISNNMYSPETRSFPATLYVIDTEVDLFELDLQSFNELRHKAVRLGSGLRSMNRDIRYKDRSGRDFYKEVHHSKGGASFHDPSYSYSLDSTFTAWRGVKLGLTPEVDEGLVAEFLQYGLALSSARRIEQRKPPSELK